MCLKQSRWEFLNTPVLIVIPEVLLYKYWVLTILQSVSQEQRERRVTVDEVPSGIYLYPEEESAVDNIFTPVSSQSCASLFEEAQKEVLRLMRIEVCFIFSNSFTYIFIPVIFL